MGHILRSCGLAKDVWLESTRKLQKSTSDEVDFLHIFAAMVEKLDPEELQLFSVTARSCGLGATVSFLGAPYLHQQR